MKLHPQVSYRCINNDQEFDIPEGDERLLIIITRPELVSNDALISCMVRLAELHDQLTLVTISTQRPTAQIGRLAARRQLVTLGPAQLSWTEEECDEYLADVVAGPEESAQLRASWHGSPAPMHLFIPTNVLMRLTEPLLELGEEGRLIWGLLHLALARTQSYAVEGLDEVLAAVANSEEAGEEMAMLSLRASLAIKRGLYHVHMGDAGRAQPLLLRGTELARISKLPYYESLGFGSSAWVLAHHGSADQSRFYASSCLEFNRKNNLGATSGTDYAYLALAELAVEDGNLEGGLEHLAHCRPILWGEQETFTLRTAALASIHLVQGQVVETLATVDSALGSSATFTDYHRILIFSNRVYAHIVDGDYAAAEAAYEAMPAGIPGTEAAFYRILVGARLHLSAGRYDKAVELAARITDHELGHPASKTLLYTLLFHAEACVALNRHEEADVLRKRAKIVAATLGVDNPGARHRNLGAVIAFTEQLTETELRVLGALDSLDSLNTIAEKLFISINTLKTHTRRIYRKLDVASRDEAVERAYIVNLLPLADRA